MRVLRPRRLVSFSIVLSLLSVPHAASADDLRAHATLGGAHAVGAPQSSELGLGAAASASLELPIVRVLGVEGKLGGLVLSKGDPPADPSLAARDTGTALFGTLGVRLRPFTDVAGPWLSAGVGATQTGDLFRPAFDAALGYDFRIARTGRWDLGPYVGYAHVLQSDDALRPEDARVLSVGIHIGLGVAPTVVRTDSDGDGVLDADDACPDVPGVKTGDPRTNGCPRGDRDGDGVFDDEDACPDLAGVRTTDPKTNGCPRQDRDDDGVFDDEDACPDLAGIRTTDPKTNGCPRKDRDGDGVFDDEDACPDVAGVRTTDPSTNGCPVPGDEVRMEQDRILLKEVVLFDTDSPRVRHASWGILEKLAKFINANPDILEVSIEGHADARGTDEYNLRLSRDRAEAVKRLLVKYHVDPSRIVAEAFGRSRLKVQTNRAEPQNRRVEFWVTRTRSAPTRTELPPAP